MKCVWFYPFSTEVTKLPKPRTWAVTDVTNIIIINILFIYIQRLRARLQNSIWSHGTAALEITGDYIAT